MARVLVVDDESEMRQMLRQALERRGYTVDEAADGREALLRFTLQQPDLVIMDAPQPP
jgi:CheY-like chemotaxis protein